MISLQMCIRNNQDSFMVSGLAIISYGRTVMSIVPDIV